MHNTRETRIAELEDLLVDTERQLVALHRNEGVEPPPPPSLPPPTNPPPPPYSSRSAPPPPPPAASEPSFQLHGAEALLRYGGIVMVLASAIFFVSTAISRGWIGTTAQLAIATVASLAMIASSFRFAADRRPWTITMAIGGTASLFVSGVVGFVGLDLLNFTTAVAWLVGSVAAFLVLSRVHDAQSIAIASVPATFAGVILLRFGSSYDPGLLCVLGAGYTLGITSVTHARSWFTARTLGASLGALVAGVGVLSMIEDDRLASSILLLTAVSVVAVLVAAASQAMDFRAVEASSDALPTAVVEARFAALTIPWIAVMVAAVGEHLEFVTFDPLWTVAAVSAGLGVAVSALQAVPTSMRLLHAAAAIGTMGIAIVGVVDGPVLLAIVLVQALLASGLAYRFRTVDMIIVATLLGTVVAGMTSNYIINGALLTGLTIAEAASVFAVIAASVGAAWLLRREGHFGNGWVATWLLTLGWAAATFRDVPQGQMIVTLVWAVVGAALVLGGSRFAEKYAVHAGMATLAATAAKLIFIDLVTVDVLWRAALFFAVGTIFLRLAFMLPKLTELPAEPAQPIEPAPPVESGAGVDS